MDANFEKMSATHYKMLKEDFEIGIIIPFIGAGLSANLDRESGLYPTWKIFLNECAENTIEEDRIKELIRREELQAAADEIYKIYPPLRDIIKHKFGKRITDYPSECPVILLPKLFPDSIVITTNFDYVLNDVYEKSSLAFEDDDCSYSNYVVFDAIRENRHYLLRLHGKANDMASIILTKSQYDAVYGCGRIDYEKPLPKALRKLLENKKLLFLGCSLSEQDRATEIIRECFHDNNAMTHYAILECDQDQAAAKKTASRLISNYGIMPIWFPYQQYDKVYEYLKELGAGSVIVKGVSFLKNKLYDKALKVFETELESLTNNSDIYFFAAISLFKGCDPYFSKISTVKKALAYLERALELQPKAGYYYLLYLIINHFYEEHGLSSTYNSNRTYELACIEGLTNEEKLEINQLLNIT